MKSIANLFTGLLKLCIILPMIFACGALGGWAGGHLPGLLLLPGMIGGYVLGCVVGGWLGMLITGWGSIKAGSCSGYSHSGRGPIPSSYVTPDYGINPANGLPMRNATHDVCWNLKFHDYQKEHAEQQQRLLDQWQQRY